MDGDRQDRRLNCFGNDERTFLEVGDLSAAGAGALPVDHQRIAEGEYVADLPVDELKAALAGLAIHLDHPHRPYRSAEQRDLVDLLLGHEAIVQRPQRQPMHHWIEVGNMVRDDDLGPVRVDVLTALDLIPQAGQLEEEPGP